MKRIGIVALAAGCFLCTARVQAKDEPGAVDFGKFSAAKNPEFVEVNIPANIIELVTNFAKKSEPEVVDAIQGLKGIHVNVIGLTDENREEVKKKMEGIRAQLDGKGWERLVTAKKDDQDVGVYIKTRKTEAIERVVVTVLEGDKQAVFVNIVGDIRPEKLATVGERFHIDPLKELGIPSKK
jgi:hypothetical protein